MLKRLLPRQDNFFDYFKQAADLIEQAAMAFSNLFHDLPHQQDYVEKIAHYEEDGNKVAEAAFELLHSSFITPFDRDHIHVLTRTLDDMINLINRCTQRFPFYGLETVPDEIIQLSLLTAEAARSVKEAVYCLHSLNRSPDIFKYCNNINAVEKKAHKTVLAGEKKLFLEENNFKEFFKFKEIYSRTKLVINRSQDVGNILKGIVLEYS